MVLQTDSHHDVHINHHIPVYTKKTQKSSGKKLSSYKYLGAAIGIHDIMLGGKEEFGRGGFGEMCVHLQWAEKLCCFTLLYIPPYLKSPYRLSLDHHVSCLRIYHLGPIRRLIKYSIFYFVP